MRPRSCKEPRKPLVAEWRDNLTEASWQLAPECHNYAAIIFVTAEERNERSMLNQEPRGELIYFRDPKMP